MALLQQEPHRPNLSFPRFITALFFAKSKSVEISVSDYLANVRSCIRAGQRPEIDSNGTRYIDTLEFWRDSHHRLRDELNEQKSRVYTLQRELDFFKGAQSQDQPKERGEKPPPVTARGKKRKRTTVPVSQPEIGEQKASALSTDTPPDPQNSSGFGSIDPQLPDAVYALQKSLLIPTTEPGLTASIMLFITSTIRSWACNPVQASSPDADGTIALLQPNATTTQAGSTIINPLRNAEDRFTPATASVTFPIILTAIDKLSSDPTARQYQQQSIYAIIKLLKDMLDQLCHLASSSTSPPEPQTTKPPTKKPRRFARVSCRNQPAPSGVKDEQQTPLVQTPSNHPLAKQQHLTNLDGFLRAAIQTLHSDSSTGPPINKTIQEGWMFVLLQKISEVLKTFVFGEDDEDWLRNSGAIDPKMHVGAHENDSSRKRKKEEEGERARKRKAKERQAPYLIHLLEKSKPGFSSAGINMPDSQTTTTTTTSAPTTTPLPLPLAAAPHSPLPRSQPLQSTILTLIFGPSSTTLFKSALQEPQIPHRVGIDAWTGISGEDIVDRFKAEVWRLVGWESLVGYLA
ncbi:MAG: hypothetical protein LQ339_001774 [Xanthoria mediterranea]|nr:MAG: hypothetical protein LQ339_001774 [Xanthoria mediterranea]